MYKVTQLSIFDLMSCLLEAADVADTPGNPLSQNSSYYEHIYAEVVKLVAVYETIQNELNKPTGYEH